MSIRSCWLEVVPQAVGTALSSSPPQWLPVLPPKGMQFTTVVDLHSTLAVSPGAECASLGRRCGTFFACPCTVLQLLLACAQLLPPEAVFLPKLEVLLYQVCT